MSVEAQVTCTISEAHLKNDKYVIQIDVVVKKKADDKLKQRKKDGYIAEAHKFMGGGKSPVFNASDESVIRFEIEEGLRPMTKFKDGQDRLKCGNLKKDEISRQIHLVPNENSSEHHAAITFYHNDEFLYQVIISDIPRGASGGQALGGANTGGEPVQRQASVRSNTSECSGSAATSGYVEAVPMPPRTQTPGSIDDGFSRADDFDDDGLPYPVPPAIPISRPPGGPTVVPLSPDASSDLPDKNTNRAFSNKSLAVLAEALGPHDAKRLLVHLNMEDAVINYELENHKGNCAGAYANLFCKWKKKEIGRGEAILRNEINAGLERIERNDIKLVFMKFSAENVDMMPADFK